MTQLFDSKSWAHFSKALVGQVHVKNSALNPLLWLCATAGLLFLPAAYFMPDYRGYLLLGAFTPTFFTILVYSYFALTDPDRLQSEEFQLQQHHMQLMQGKESPLIIEGEVKLVPNPDLMLEGGE